jgi:glucose-1-phosphate cytidylyltransferase
VKVVILAGGLGTRLAEETEVRPKPMVEIGERPILWHILKHYEHYGFHEFLVALGYKGDFIRRYFLDYANLGSNLSVDLGKRTVASYTPPSERWVVDLMETGGDTNTGGRVRRLQPWLNETFMLTYGDGVSNVDLGALLAFHRSHGKLATITAVRPPSRFGALELDGDRIGGFTEKPQTGEGWINGGYMVLEPAIFGYLDKGDSSSLEGHALERLAAEGQLMGYRHDDFWQCMDTLRDKRSLDAMWKSDTAAWKVWK